MSAPWVVDTYGKLTADGVSGLQGRRSLVLGDTFRELGDALCRHDNVISDFLLRLADDFDNVRRLSRLVADPFFAIGKGAVGPTLAGRDKCSLVIRLVTGGEC